MKDKQAGDINAVTGGQEPRWLVKCEDIVSSLGRAREFSRPREIKAFLSRRKTIVEKASLVTRILKWQWDSRKRVPEGV